MATKRYLFTPGPTPVPPEVLAAVGAPVIHHRAPEFLPVYERVLNRLREVCRTESDVLLFGASGTGAFESAVANLTSPGDRQLVLSAGNFGERWAGMVEAFGAELIHARLAWGETPEPEDLRSALAEAGDVRVVYLTHSETSTGVVCDVQALAAVAKEAGALVVVDAVSSLAAVPLETDAWDLDVVVSGSQKALMTPPGLAFVSVSPAALEAAARSTSPRYVLDWERTRKAQAKLDAAFTPPVSLVAALDVALGLLLEEGLDAVFDRHVRLGRAARAGAKAMGLELFSPDEDRSAVVTAIRAPEGIDARELVKGLRDRFGMTIANGQGDLMGKIFRLGHIGWFDVFDITAMLAAVETVLADLGADIERGVAVTAALEAYEHGQRVA
jgi:serine---pyruvate transaminase